MNISEKNLEAFNAIYDFGLSDEIIKQLPKIKERVTKAGQRLGYQGFVYLYRSPKLLLVINPLYNRYHQGATNFFGVALEGISPENKTFLDKHIAEGEGHYFFANNVRAKGHSPTINQFLDTFHIGKSNDKDVQVNSVLIKINFKKFTETFLNELKTLSQVFVSGKTYSGGLTFLNLVPPLEATANTSDGLLDKLKKYITDNKNFFFDTKAFQLYPTSEKTTSHLELYKTFIELLHPECKTTLVELNGGKVENASVAKIIATSSTYSVIGLVAEFDNTRTIVSGSFESDPYSRRYDNADTSGMVWKVASFTQADHPDLYDYLDVGRLMYRFSTNALGQLANNVGMFIELEDPKTISANLLNEFVLGRKEQVVLIDNDSIDRITNRELRKAALQKQEAVASEKLKKKAKTLFKNLTEQKGEIKFNDMVITADSVKYETEELSFSEGNEKTWLSNLLTRASEVRDIKHVNFDHIMTGFISHIMAKHNGTIAGTLGSVKFKVEHVEKQNARGHYVTTYRINGHRINKGEVQECLERAVCYQNQTDYDYFLKEVKKCSLRIHSYLELGVDATIFDELQNKQLKIKFLLEKKDGKNTVVINKNNYTIKAINRFLSIENKNNLIDMVELLLNEDIVEGIDLKDMKGIIEKATETFKNAVAKSEELLNKTVKMFNLELETSQIGGSTRTGYKIDGKKGTYFLELENNDAHTNRCGVYDYNTGSYICIVDKSTAQVGKDKIVNRIFALHNDEKVATQINTLNK